MTAMTQPQWENEMDPQTGLQGFEIAQRAAEGSAQSVDLWAWLKECWAAVLVPATFWGAAGGVSNALKHGVGWQRCLLKGISGAMVAHLCGPLITKHIPQDWQSIAIFLVGWGGLELGDKAYTEAVAIFRIVFRQAVLPKGVDVPPAARDNEEKQ